MRLPSAVTWGSPRVGCLPIDAQCDSQRDVCSSSSNNIKKEALGILHVDDIVDAFISAMLCWYASSKPAAFELTSGKTSSLEHVKDVAQSLLSTASNTTTAASQPGQTVMMETIVRRLRQGGIRSDLLTRQSKRIFLVRWHEIWTVNLITAPRHLTLK
jgi:hypothetical protein